MNAKSFDSIDWKGVAGLLGARFVSHVSGVRISIPSRRDDPTSAMRHLLISDNCGEVNITEVVPALKPDRSVPLPGTDFRYPHEAMAQRLYFAIYGLEGTDYEFGRKREEDDCTCVTSPGALCPVCHAGVGR